MGKMTWAAFLERVQKEFPNAKPEKVFNMLKTVYGKSSQESLYQILRNSWAIDVVSMIYRKKGTFIGTPREERLRKKRTTRDIIRNWCKSKDYDISYRTFHPGPNNPQFSDSTLNMYKDLSLRKHIKNCNDIWVSKKGKELRKVLEANKGQIPAYFKDTHKGMFAIETEEDKAWAKSVEQKTGKKVL